MYRPDVDTPRNGRGVVARDAAMRANVRGPLHAAVTAHALKAKRCLNFYIAESRFEMCVRFGTVGAQHLSVLGSQVQILHVFEKKESDVMM